MSDQPKQPWEARLREAGAQVEDDLRKLIGYVNDEVMPEVRRNGSAALRTAATELSKLAQKMEESNRAAAPVNPPKPPPSSEPQP